MLIPASHVLGSDSGRNGTYIGRAAPGEWLLSEAITIYIAASPTAGIPPLPPSTNKSRNLALACPKINFLAAFGEGSCRGRILDGVNPPP